MPASNLCPNTQPDDPALQSVWQVQEAKNRFSELVEAALAQGPQARRYGYSHCFHSYHAWSYASNSQHPAF
jgi:hypothetical protein